MSFKIWPTEEWNTSPLLRELITISELPLKDERWKLVSMVNCTALLAAKASTATTEGSQSATWEAYSSWYLS